MNSSITVLAAASVGDTVIAKLPKLSEVVTPPDLAGVMGLDFETAPDAALKVRSFGIYSTLGNRFNYDIFQRTSDDANNVKLSTLASKLTAEQAGMLLSLYKMNPEMGLQIELEIGVLPAGDWTSNILWTIDNQFGGNSLEAAFQGTNAAVGAAGFANNSQGLTSANQSGTSAMVQTSNPAVFLPA